MLKERINDFYDLKVVSSKKYLDGATKVKYSSETLSTIAAMTKNMVRCISMGFTSPMP